MADIEHTTGLAAVVGRLTQETHEGHQGPHEECLRCFAVQTVRERIALAPHDEPTWKATRKLLRATTAMAKVLQTAAYKRDEVEGLEDWAFAVRASLPKGKTFEQSERRLRDWARPILLAGGFSSTQVAGLMLESAEKVKRALNAGRLFKKGPERQAQRLALEVLEEARAAWPRRDTQLAEADEALSKIAVRLRAGVLPDASEAKRVDELLDEVAAARPTMAYAFRKSRLASQLALNLRMRKVAKGDTKEQARLVGEFNAVADTLANSLRGRGPEELRAVGEAIFAELRRGTLGGDKQASKNRPLSSAKSDKDRVDTSCARRTQPGRDGDAAPKALHALRDGAGHRNPEANLAPVDSRREAAGIQARRAVGAQERRHPTPVGAKRAAASIPKSK